MTRAEGTILSCRIILISKYRRNAGNRKLPLDHNGNNFLRPDPLVNVKIGGQNFKENQDNL